MLKLLGLGSVAWPTWTSVRSGENSHGDKCYDEGDVEHDQREANPRRCAVRDTESGDHGGKSVENGGGEDAFDSAIGVHAHPL